MSTQDERLWLALIEVVAKGTDENSILGEFPGGFITCVSISDTADEATEYWRTMLAELSLTVHSIERIETFRERARRMRSSYPDHVERVARLKEEVDIAIRSGDFVIGNVTVYSSAEDEDQAST